VVAAQISCVRDHHELANRAAFDRDRLAVVKTTPEWKRTKGGTRLQIGDVSFGPGGFLAPPGENTATRFSVRKSRYAIDVIAEEIARLKARNIVEIGMGEGGSAALLAQLSDPKKLVAIEYDPTPLEALGEFITGHGLEERLKPYYGVDQGDRARVDAILDDEFGTEALDLAIDDASHLLHETRVSFNAVFPRLRPGGVFMLEDWNWTHLQDGEGFCIGPSGRDHWPTGEPLSLLVLEFVMTQASDNGIITKVTIDDASVRVERGPAELDWKTFDITRAYRPGAIRLTTS
jgi:SAM-dependent methyltransferase